LWLGGVAAFFAFFYRGRVYRQEQQQNTAKNQTGTHPLVETSTSGKQTQTSPAAIRLFLLGVSLVVVVFFFPNNFNK
jgi:hypothetical protein